jgi:hypothetical protein
LISNPIIFWFLSFKVVSAQFKNQVK